MARTVRLKPARVTLERAVKVLDALNVRLRTKVELDAPREMASA